MADRQEKRRTCAIHLREKLVSLNGFGQALLSAYVRGWRGGPGQRNLGAWSRSNVSVPSVSGMLLKPVIVV